MWFYEKSTELNAISTTIRNFVGLNLFRYKHIVDSSERGVDCVYAKMCERQYNESELQVLIDFRNRLDLLIGELSEYSANQNSSD